MPRVCRESRFAQNFGSLLAQTMGLSWSTEIDLHVWEVMIQGNRFLSLNGLTLYSVDLTYVIFYKTSNS